MKVHVIMLNDSVQLAVIDNEQIAEAKKIELQQKYFDRDPWQFDRDWERYKARCFWHIKTVEGVTK